MDELFTLAEAAVLVGRSHSTLRHQVQRGRIDARLIGKTWVVTRAELTRYATQVRRPVMLIGYVQREETT